MVARINLVCSQPACTLSGRSIKVTAISATKENYRHETNQKIIVRRRLHHRCYHNGILHSPFCVSMVIFRQGYTC